MLAAGIVGAGTMGRGIAHSAALAGHQVILYDIAEDLLQEARARMWKAMDRGVELGKTDKEAAEQAMSSVRLTTRLEDAAEADIVIEAAPEDFELKREIFAALDEAAPTATILASNTSSLSISALAGATRRPDRFIGLHFFNPAHIMRLVEVITGEDTSQETVQAALSLVTSMGKTPVLCKDTPAFIVNRVARPFYGEAFRLLGEQAADVETIDRLVRSLGFRMGPFQLIDLIGCDVNLAVTESVYEAYYHDPKYRPHPIQRRMVESGNLGRKTGRGFYRHE